MLGAARIIRPMGADRIPTRGPAPGPVAEEALDALVAVLDEVRLGHSQSRSDLVAHTGLSRSIVAQRVAELLDRGLVVEGDPGPSTGGRPPRQLTFRADAGHVLVADLGATSIDVAVTTLDGRILGHHDEPASIADGPDVALDRVEELFGQLLATTRGLPGRIWGIGIGVPGPVEYRTGRPISPPIMPGWDGYPVRDRLASRYDAPVWVDNDVNVLALGEWRSGIAAGSDNVVVVKVGTGIGAGIIAEGRLHRGAQGSAGDVGHIQVVRGSRRRLPVREHRLPRGAGGRRGDRPRRRGGRARGPEPAPAGGARPPRNGDGRGRRAGRLVRGSRRGRAAPGRGPADRGDARRRRELLQPVAGRRSAAGVAQSGDVLLAAIREAVYARSLPLATRDLLIRRSSLGGLAGVIGASSMVVDQLFARESLARWAGAGEPSGMPDVVLASAG